MRTKMLLKLLCLTLVIANCTACSTLLQDRRDAPWDPKTGRGIGMDQIPNNQGGALQLCGGHMQPEQAMREGRSMRC